MKDQKQQLNMSQPFVPQFIINRNIQPYQNKMSQIFDKTLILNCKKQCNHFRILQTNSNNIQIPTFQKKYNSILSLTQQIQYLVQNKKFISYYTQEIINQLIIREGNSQQINQSDQQTNFKNIIVLAYNLYPKDMFSTIIYQLIFAKQSFFIPKFLQKFILQSQLISSSQIIPIIWENDLYQINSFQKFFHQTFLKHISDVTNIPLCLLMQSQFYIKFYQRQFLLLIQHLLSNIYKLFLQNKYVQENEVALQSAYIIDQCNLQIQKHQQDHQLLKTKLLKLEKESELKTVNLVDSSQKKSDKQNAVTTLSQQFQSKQYINQTILSQNEHKSLVNEDQIYSIQMQYYKINPQADELQQLVSQEQIRRDQFKDQVQKKKQQMENIQKEALYIKQLYQEKLGQIYSQEQQIIQDEQRFQKLCDKDSQNFQKRAEQIFLKLNNLIDIKIQSFTQIKSCQQYFDFQQVYQELKGFYQSSNLQIDNFSIFTPCIEQKLKQQDYLKAITDSKFAALSSNITKLSEITLYIKEHVQQSLFNIEQTRLYQQERLELLQNQLDGFRKEQIELKGIVEAINNENRWKLRPARNGLTSLCDTPIQEDTIFINKEIQGFQPIVEYQEQDNNLYTPYQKMQVLKYKSIERIIFQVFNVKNDQPLKLDEFLNFCPFQE